MKIFKLKKCVVKHLNRVSFLFFFFPSQDDKLQYVNTLQPKYSSIDVTEVELPETDANTIANNDMLERERVDENTNMLLDVRISSDILLRFVHLLDIEFFFVVVAVCEPNHSCYVFFSFFILHASLFFFFRFCWEFQALQRFATTLMCVCVRESCFCHRRKFITNT